MNGRLFNVGKIVNTHGIRGEVKVLLQTDFPEERFHPGSELLLTHPERPNQLAVKVQAVRPHKHMLLVQFEGYTTMNDAEQLKGWQIKVGEEYLLDLEEDEYYYHEIIGCSVLTDEGETLGKVTEILSPGANDVWVVQRPQGKPVYIPYIHDVVLDVNVDEKTVRIHPMEGLID